jgi:hypothetical protein
MNDFDTDYDADVDPGDENDWPELETYDDYDDDWEDDIEWFDDDDEEDDYSEDSMP